MAERLQKVMAHDGIASRRKSEKIIQSGRVKVNGKTITTLGTKVNPHKDEIEVDDVPLDKEEPVYFLFYKPRQVISSVSDNKNRKTVVDFFSDVSERIYPVGRLDYDTSGVLLLTNDGDFDNLLTHPRYEVSKTYVARVKGVLSNDDFKKLRTGVIVNGNKTTVDHSKLVQINSKTDTSIINVTLHEGKNHEVKNIFKAIDHPVTKLKRISYGFLTLHKLRAGQWRPLKKFEVDKLKEMAKKQLKNG
ncbi:pseudouridine synthase [Philodulcilactobacillus myokoensis]|uniref:Pseudouridine synthase n=1 Tax=Philodulcilactobacillus myokoensis TaxID=2929573 RepID=A0A9W6B0U1_9LACO|nr:pseudouridine synthase [Philodulcilactobacillus myokoensis]GLB46894.1 pseudouridine synthase [Philodulcilactobacillus myokoensis]